MEASNSPCWGAKLTEQVQFLIKKTAEQEATINALKVAISRDSDKNDVSNKIEALTSLFKNLEMKCTSLHNQIKIPGNNGSIAENVLILQEKIESTHRKVQLKAEISDMILFQDTFKSNLKQLNDSVLSDMASIELVEQLEDTIEDVSKMMTVLNSKIETKMDTKDVNRLDIASTKISTFKKYIEETTSRLNTVEENTKSNRSAMQECLKAVDVVSNQILSTQKIVNTLPSKDLLQNSLSETATKTNACMLKGSNNQEKLKHHENVISNLKSDIEDILKDNMAVQNSIQHKLSIKADKCDLESKADLSLTNKQIGSILKDLQSKAWSKNVSELEVDTHDISIAVTKLKSQVDVVLRFVDWFSSRGDAYEHNFKVMESHLAGLAHTATKKTSNIKYKL